MRRVALLAIAAALGCPRVAPSPPPAPKPRGRVVVALVVDQMAAWMAAERWPLLPRDGGFARLAAEGTFVAQLRYAHAVTDTAPGHAALFTGKVPRETGINGNEAVDESGKHRSALRDAKTKLVTPNGIVEQAGSSIAPLRVDTVADRLRAARPESFIVSVSIKDRGAIFGGGRKPDATIWFDVGLDAFVTSTAFASALPAWSLAHATNTAVKQSRARPWDPIDRAWVQQHAFAADDAAGEGDWEGLGTTFPHDVANAKKPSVAFRATPWADDAVLALAVAALRARDASKPMLLSVSLSAHDYVNHVFGPDSWESWDELLRLDRSLARFFAVLDDAVSKDGWSIVLAGDHGGPPLPEQSSDASARVWCETPDRWARRCGEGHRLLVDELASSLEETAVSELGPGHWVAGVADPYVFLTEAARGLDEGRRKKLDAALAARLAAIPGVAEVHAVRTLPATCPDESDESVAALVCRSTPREGPGDLYVVTAPGSFFDPRYATGKGQNHGSPWLFDRTVPMLARAPGRVAEGRTLVGPLSYATFARTLQTLLDLPSDPAIGGKDLAALEGGS